MAARAIEVSRQGRQVARRRMRQPALSGPLLCSVEARRAGTDCLGTALVDVGATDGGVPIWFVKPR
jgi:hypothetical protein